MRWEYETDASCRLLDGDFIVTVWRAAVSEQALWAWRVQRSRAIKPHEPEWAHGMQLVTTVDSGVVDHWDGQAIAKQQALASLAQHKEAKTS